MSASPFNGVKLELGLAVILLIAVIIATETWVAQSMDQLVILAGAAAVCAAWLIFRIRQVLAIQATEPSEND